jgi:alpha-glucosidase (family GH31 glycosyl hydrolase)
LQLRNPKNIKLINELEITLSIEYEKFVHLKIKNAEKERWEIPIKEILNKDYLNNKDKNTIFLSKNTKCLNSKEFFIEFFANNSKQIDEFSFRLMTKEKNEFYYFNTSRNFLFSENYINFQSELTSDFIYGFGERTHDFKLGQGLYTIWSQDSIGTSYDKGLGGGNQYSHQPIALHKTKYQNLWLGFVFLNTNDQDVKISQINEVNYLEHKTIGGIIDYYIIVDHSPEEILKNIQFLLGIPTLPPFWTLGNHQCRYGYNNFEEFKNVYELYKKYEIPIDVMWIDIDAMKDYEIFTINDKFEQIGPFIKDEIHKDGCKFIPIIDLGLSYENQNSNMVKLGNDLDIFIKSNYTKKTLIGKVWPGKTVFPDFMNPNISKFWNTGLSLYHDLTNFDGIWLDMNEPANVLNVLIPLHGKYL